jgi:tetratricopeptide (TPR) repeat protein
VKNIFLILLTLLTFVNSYTRAQNKTDSLENLLKTELPDSSRIRILIQLSTLNQYIDFDHSRNYTDEAMTLAEKLDIPQLKALTYRSKAFLLSSSGDYSTAIRYDNLALENNIFLKDSVMISRDFNNIGNDYYDLGEYDDAYYYFTQSHRVASAVRDTLRMLIAYHNVGRVFKELGQYERALDHLNLAKKMSLQQKDEEGIPYAYDEIGDVQLRRNEYDSALSTLELALTLSRKLHVNTLEPKILSKLATTHLKKGDFVKARSYHDSAYSLNTIAKDRYGVAEAELGRGIVYTMEGKYAEALTKIENSLAVAKALGNER